jgi:hypothetical protein
MQIGFQSFFQSTFADIFAKPIASECNVLDFPLGDLPQVAEKVRRRFAIRVGAHGTHLGEHAGQRNPVLLNDLHHVPTDILGQRNRPVAGIAPPLFPAPGEFRRLHTEIQGEQIEQLLLILHRGRENRDVERRAIVDQQFAVTIINGAARSGDGDVANTVFFRQGKVAVGGNHLQVPQTQDQQQKDAGSGEREQKKSFFEDGDFRPARIKSHGDDPDATAPAP